MRAGSQELPAANLNALWLLLETLNRIAADAAKNEMDARALAASLAPRLAWKAPPPKTLAQVDCCPPCSNQIYVCGQFAIEQ